MLKAIWDSGAHLLLLNTHYLDPVLLCCYVYVHDVPEDSVLLVLQCDL